jgi:hypothetical protein
MILIGNINVLPCFENIHKVYKPNIIPRKTDAKLKRWSKFGLLRPEEMAIVEENRPTVCIYEGDEYSLRR